jgi:hypothetical protein
MGGDQRRFLVVFLFTLISTSWSDWFTKVRQFRQLHCQSEKSVGGLLVFAWDDHFIPTTNDSKPIGLMLYLVRWI